VVEGSFFLGHMVSCKPLFWRMVLIPLSKMTDVYEGSLIRMFRRLEELLRQMAQAAKVMGSDELEKKFEDSLSKVKRGGLLEN